MIHKVIRRNSFYLQKVQIKLPCVFQRSRKVIKKSVFRNQFKFFPWSISTIQFINYPRRILMWTRFHFCISFSEGNALNLSSVPKCLASSARCIKLYIFYMHDTRFSSYTILNWRRMWINNCFVWSFHSKYKTGSHRISIAELKVLVLKMYDATV